MNNILQKSWNGDVLGMRQICELLSIELLGLFAFSKPVIGYWWILASRKRKTTSL